MVYLRAVTPALCEVMDASVAASPPNTTNSSLTADIRDFIEQRLRSLVHTQTPSQLDNAVWVYLVAQEQLLLRHEAGDVNKDRTRTALPPSLQLPEAIGGVQEAVMWYCGELTTTENASSGAATAATAQNESSSSPSARPSMFRRNAPLRQRDDSHNTGARLDELLRHRHQPAAAATTTTSTLKPDSAAAGAETRSSVQPSATKTGPLATLRLALEALAHPKRAAALRQPRSLALIVRSLVSLWSVVYLCKQLRLHQLRKEQVLKGGEMAGTAATAAAAAASSAIAVCFNDFDLLLPWDLVAAVYPGETMAAVAARCRESRRQHNDACVFVDNSKKSDVAPVSLVINPAETVLDDNPDRLRKNARVDAIDEAANKYYYTLLATRAHGQAEAALRNTSGGAAPSTSGAAAAASAAAHQEAVRSSLATVDLGDYGVLDPSRMRAPVPLSSPSGGGGLRGSNSNGASAERNAKSYALFLRDASIGFDIQIMALTGAGVGYYIGYLRSLSTEWCTLYAVIGLATMMLVDAVLIMIRMGRQDAAALRSRKRIRRQREKLEREGERLVQAMQQAAASAEGPTDKVRPAGEGDGAADTDAFTKKRQ